jgi:hypothetical protein
MLYATRKEEQQRKEVYRKQKIIAAQGINLKQFKPMEKKRTIITIDKELLINAKKKAKLERRTFGGYLEILIENDLATQNKA